MLDLIMVLVGVGLLAGGGELLIRGALSMARLLSVPPLVSGLVIVGFGTSAPELVVSLDAALKGAHEIAVGNVLGSNIANILLILGVCALIGPLRLRFSSVKRDASVMIAAGVLVMLLLNTGELTRAGALVLLLTLLGYLLWTFRSESRCQTPEAQRHKEEAKDVSGVPGSAVAGVVEVVGGIALLAGGAKVLLYGATHLALAFDITESVIGLTLVAVGTSLPELTLSIVAMRKGHADVAVGNVLGSNIFNLLGILGLSALLQPLNLSHSLMLFDQWVMLASALLLMLLMYSGWILRHFTGWLLLSLYLGYLLARYLVL